jgi:hypothetical protein
VYHLSIMVQQIHKITSVSMKNILIQGQQRK